MISREGTIICILVIITMIYERRFSSLGKTSETVVIRSFFYTIPGDDIPDFF